MSIDRTRALNGALVADAAALGLHWLYDQDHIAVVEKSGSVLFRQPDATVFEGQKAFFAHAGRHAGQLSHYGESARLLASVCADGTYDANEHRRLFLESFGPCGSFQGYADRPTKALVATILGGGDDLEDPTGIEDDQMPGLCPVAGVFAAGLSINETLNAVKVISIHDDVIESAKLLHSCLEHLATGVALQDALSLSANSGEGPICNQIQVALNLDKYQPLEAANQFGLACHVPQGMPVVWHILNHAQSFEMAVRDNVRCGGDSCGRAMILGALAGMAFEIPTSMSQLVVPPLALVSA